jgi:transcriptional regulatory protein GAL4
MTSSLAAPVAAPEPAPATFLPPAFVPVVGFASSSEALEKQPRNASGYEWNERANSSKPSQDGTASLSLEPDGQGYLGFASGATLLRILQIIAGVSHIDVPAAAGPPSDSAGWQPTDAEMTACVDAYFTYYHAEYPLIHEATFRAQWNEVIPPPSGPGWDLLTNVVLALGAFVSFRPMEAVDFFLERALTKVNVDCLEVGSLTLVQGFTLLSNITQKRNKPNAGSIYLGIATRMATSLGLHRELPSWQITPHEREVRYVDVETVRHFSPDSPLLTLQTQDLVDRLLL